MDENIKRYGEYPFIKFQGYTFTNVEIKRAINDLQIVLSSLSVNKGDRVIVCMPNRPEVICSYQAIIRSGAIIVPVMHRLHEKEITHILNNSGAKAIITSAEPLPKIKRAVEPLEDPPLIIYVDDVPTDDTIKTIPWDLQTSSNKIVKEKQFLQVPSLTMSDLAVIMYTSGTTGKPKGVMLTYKNLTANLHARAYFRDETQETMLGILPLAHSFGLGVMNVSLYKGDTFVIFSSFDVTKVCKAIEEYRVKILSAVPAMLYQIVTNPQIHAYDLSSLEIIKTGSAPLPFHIRQAFSHLTNAVILDAYGLTEAAPSVSRQRKDRKIKHGSVGFPVPGVDIKVVDSEDKEVKQNEIGELIVKGDNITPGYYKNEQATKETIKNGWLYTGDLARIDEDGELFIEGRSSELIIRGGFNIYPLEIEEILASHPSVSEVAVVGVPSEVMGEEVVAFVVPQRKSVSAVELLTYCQNKIAKYKTPRDLLFVNELPKSGIGKVLKKELQHYYEQKRIIN